MLGRICAGAVEVSHRAARNLMARATVKYLLLAMTLVRATTAVAQSLGGSVADAAASGLSFSVGDAFTYDDNLYRLPSFLTLANIASRQDHINTINAGFDGRLVAWRQDIALTVRAADNRFSRNDALNNVSGAAKLQWDWLVSPRLTGTLGADYTRVLASFANTSFFAKDLVGTVDYFGTTRFRLAQHWTLLAGLKGTKTTHSADQRQGDEFNSKSGSVGIEYVTSALNTFGLGYSYQDVHFPQPGILDAIVFDRSYKDGVEQVSMKYRLGGKTELAARAGYLRRRYPNSVFGSFSGDTWRAQLKYAATGKTQLVLAGWRELTAYLDAESDYFVSRGGSVSVVYSPTVKIALSLSSVVNSQIYISTSPSTEVFNSRHDNVRTQQATLQYSPRDLLDFQLSYRYETRDSNRPQLGYGDRVAAAQINLKL